MPTPVSRTLMTICGASPFDAASAWSGSAFHREPDVTVPLGELARVVQEVTHDLRQSSRVGVHVHRNRRQHDRQFLTSPFGDRASGFHCVVDDRRHLDPLSAKVDLAAADPTRVEQIVDEPHHLSNLTLQYVQCVVDTRTQVQGLYPFQSLCST